MAAPAARAAQQPWSPARALGLPGWRCGCKCEYLMWRSGAMGRAAARELIKGTRGDGAACGGCRGSGVGPAVWRWLYTYN